MQLKSYKHPTFAHPTFLFWLQGQAFVKRPSCSSELLPLGFIWLSSILLWHLSQVQTMLSQVLSLLERHNLPLQLQSPVLLELSSQHIYDNILGFSQKSPKTVDIWSHDTSSAESNRNGELSGQLSPIYSLLCQNFIRPLDASPKPYRSYSSAHQAKIRSRSHRSTLQIVTRSMVSWIILYI